jgi:hypothetical protein
MDNSQRTYLARKLHSVEDGVLDDALQSFEGTALKFSADAISDATQRENYNRHVKRIKDEVLSEVRAGRVSVKEAARHCYEMRNKIMAEIRAKTSVVGRAIAESKKSVSPELEELFDQKSVRKYGSKFGELLVGQRNDIYYEIVESSARPNTHFNTANKVLKYTGKVLIVVTIAYAAYEISEAENPSREALKQGGAMGSGVLGTALAGATVSVVCGPGAPVCAIGFMLAAGVASSLAASAVMDLHDEELEEFARWNIR